MPYPAWIVAFLLLVMASVPLAALGDDPTPAQDLSGKLALSPKQNVAVWPATGENNKLAPNYQATITVSVKAEDDVGPTHFVLIGTPVVTAFFLLNAATLTRGEEASPTPPPAKVIAEEHNSFFQRIETRDGPRDVGVQVKLQTPEGANPAESFPEDQQIIYEVREYSPSINPAAAPIWQLTTPRPGGPSWRTVLAKCIYAPEEDLYYLFLCPRHSLLGFHVFKVRRGKRQIIDVFSLNQSPAYHQPIGLPVNTWSFERHGNEFRVDITYFSTNRPPDRFIVPLSAIP